MVREMESMETAKLVLVRMAKGVDPLTGEIAGADSFLNNPDLIRCFYFINGVLDQVTNGAFGRSNKQLPFLISQEQKDVVCLPEGKIGVTEFSRRINLCIDPMKSRKLNGVDLNKRLKKQGILGEVENPATGKTRTTINENSESYGFELENRTFNGTEYEMVVMNNKGKQYLMDNLEAIMSLEM